MNFETHTKTCPLEVIFLKSITIFISLNSGNEWIYQQMICIKCRCIIYSCTILICLNILQKIVSITNNGRCHLYISSRYTILIHWISIADKSCSNGKSSNINIFPFRKPLEPPSLSRLSYRSFQTHEDNLNFSTGNKELINPDQEQLDIWKMDPNNINPILPPSPKPFNNVAIGTPKKHRQNHMKDVWLQNNWITLLLDSYQDSLERGTILGIPRNNSHCWTISWDNYFVVLKIFNKSLFTEGMKCDSKMAEYLINACKKFVKDYLVRKRRQGLKK